MTVVVTLEGTKLLLHAGSQPAPQLLAQSPNTFFLKDTMGLIFEFDTDADGNVKGLTVVQGDQRQRAVRTK